jgi:hypothetical protein
MVGHRIRTLKAGKFSSPSLKRHVSHYSYSTLSLSVSLCRLERIWDTSYAMINDMTFVIFIKFLISLELIYILCVQNLIAKF